MSHTHLEDYKPSDKGWGVVVGRLMPKPASPPAKTDEVEEQSEEDEQQS